MQSCLMNERKKSEDRQRIKRQNKSKLENEVEDQQVLKGLMVAK